MLYHDTLNQTVQALRDFAIDKPESCPDFIFDQIRKANGDLPEMAELLRSIYDVPVKRGGKETIGPQLAQIAAAGLSVFARSRFMDLGKPDQDNVVPAERMRLALLRDAGEPALAGLNWPDPEQDPERRPPPQQQNAGASAPAPNPTPASSTAE